MSPFRRRGRAESPYPDMRIHNPEQQLLRGPSDTVPDVESLFPADRPSAQVRRIIPPHVWRPEPVDEEGRLLLIPAADPSPIGLTSAQRGSVSGILGPENEPRAVAHDSDGAVIATGSAALKHLESQYGFIIC